MIGNENHIVVVTALSVEATAIRALGQEWREEIHHRGTIYERGQFGGWDTLLAVVGAGNQASAQETERAIAHFSPQIVALVGIAGGVKDVGLGDVVAATKIYSYEHGADKETFLPRPDVGQSSYRLVQRARVVAQNNQWYVGNTPQESASAPKAYIGPIAAGEKVIKSSEGAVAKLLQQNYGDTLAVEMEGAGFIRAAYSSGVEALIVRGISDLLDKKADADAGGSQERASAHAAAFALAVLVQMHTAQASISSLASKEIDWNLLHETVARLYPSGPVHSGLWERAGGDISRLDLSGNGRTQWRRAILRIKHGGDVSVARLVDQMIEDYPRNVVLQDLKRI